MLVGEKKPKAFSACDEEAVAATPGFE